MSENETAVPKVEEQVEDQTEQVEQAQEEQQVEDERVYESEFFFYSVPMILRGSRYHDGRPGMMMPLHRG